MHVSQPKGTTRHNKAHKTPKKNHISHLTYHNITIKSKTHFLDQNFHKRKRNSRLVSISHLLKYLSQIGSQYLQHNRKVKYKKKKRNYKDIFRP